MLKSTETDSNISIVEGQNIGEVSLNIEKPKRILHFSDGTMEVFSESDSDSDNNVENKHNKEDINIIKENELQWGPWFLYKTKETSKTILKSCDYVGESLAAFLGITSPKYELEIHHMLQEKKRMEKEKLKNATWYETKELNNNKKEVITKEIIPIQNLNEKF